jgi:Acyl-CoA dehydrogenase, C-terminal domain
MNLDFDTDQKALVDALGALLDAHGGPIRARELGAVFDTTLDSRLAESGWFAVFGDGSGPAHLDAVLAIQTIARGLGNVSAIAKCLVAPALGVELRPGPLPLLDASGRGRYAAGANRGLQVSGTGAYLCTLDPDSAAQLSSPYGYPLAQAAITDRVLVGNGVRAMSLWRLGLAAEAAGLMSAALDMLVSYLAARVQFGRPLAGFQALRHRMAELYVLVEGSRLLAYEGAWRSGTPEAAAKAATMACVTARRVVRESHQLTGAIGLTREFDLHLWSLRLHAITLEAGGRRAHARATALEHWRPSPGGVTGSEDEWLGR